MPVSLKLLRRIALAITAATVIVAAAGLGKLQLNSHYTAYFDEHDPQLAAHQAIADLYARDDGLFVVLKSTRSFLNADNYQLIERATAALQAQPFSTRVASISELAIIGDPFAADGTDIPSVEQLRDDGRALGVLLSEDLNVAGIWVQLKLPAKDSLTVLETVSAIRQLVDSLIADLPISSHYTSTLALNEAYITVVQRDLKLLLPLLLLVTTLLLSQLLRSGWAVSAMLPVAIGATAAAFGLAGLAGAELAAISTFTPIIIFGISLAACVHLVHSYVHYRDAGRDPEDAALDAVGYNRIPMLLANGTTALGFLGLAFSPSPPIRVVGYLVAAGIIVSFMLSMTLLPSLLARFDPWRPPSTNHSTALNKLARFVAQRRVILFVVFLTLAFPAAWFTSRNVVSDNVFEYFSSSHAFHQDAQLVDSELSGVNELLYSVDSGRVSAFFSADAMNALSQFSTWLNQQPEVNRTLSIADTEAIKEARSEGRLQQRLNFYRSRLANGDQNPELRSAVAPDYSSSLVIAYLAALNSAELNHFDRRVHAWAAEHLPGFTLQSGGPALLFAKLGEQNIRSMLTALTAALLVAALILGVVFRSKRTALIGVICNFLPILFVYAVWAIVSGQISIGAAVVMGMVLGIVLDDTVYFLSSYHYAARSAIREPVTYALNRVAPAVIVTSVTLIAGLSMGLLSDFGPIWSMSALSVSIIAVALIVDLLLLPALLSTNHSNKVTT